MADDLDDIEDLLEAPYKIQKSDTNGSNGFTNGDGTNGHDKDVEMRDEKKKSEDSKDGKSSKKSRKNRSKSRSRSRSRSKHRKRSRSRSRSKKSKRSRSRSRDRHRDRRRRSGSRDRSRDRDRDRSRDKDRDRDRRRRSRSKSRSRSRRRDDSRSRRHRNSSRDRRSRSRTPPKREKSPELTPEERDIRTVFVMQLSKRIRPRDLEDFFSSVGSVRDVRLITDPRTKRSKGIAYIEFREPESVPLAIALTGQRLLGVPLIVKETQGEKNRMPLMIPNQGTAIIPDQGPMKLYLGSLHVNINEEMLHGIFEPFGKIDQISLCRDEFGRSKGYGFIQFADANDAKKAMEQLNNFEIASRPMKVTPFIEKPLDGNAAISNLDNDELDRTGVNLGPSGKLALMAKLAEGTGIKIPQVTLDALSMASQANSAAANNNTPNTATQCFLLSNMFDLEEERTKPNWVQDIRDDVIEECTKYGGVVHISIDQTAPDGRIYIKCPTIAIATSVMGALNGRYFAGKLIQASFIPIATYHQKFPEAVYAQHILMPSVQ